MAAGHYRHWSAVALVLLVAQWSVLTSAMSSTLRSAISSYRRRDLASSRQPITIWAAPYRHSNLQCTPASGRCYTSSTCCKGLVCADIDTRRETRPDVPGYCVREKDLQSCTDTLDCRSDCRCVELSAGQSYCLPMSVAVSSMASVADSHGWRQFPNIREDGGLGADCETSSDCNPVTDGGTSRLCCQRVRRGRQAPKKMCDRVTSISFCIDS